jgi:hypothetical protein
LTGFQHFGDELRAARRTGMAAVTAIVPRTAGAAGTAFESRAGRASAVWTTVWTTIWAAIGTAATGLWAATAAAIASTTLGTLETGSRIAADTGGIARKVFARSGGAADTGRASLPGKQNDIVFDDSRLSGDFACMRFDYFRSGMFLFAMFKHGVFGHDMLGLTEGGSVFRAFMCGVGCEFGAVGGAMRFDFCGFILGEFGFRGCLIFRSVEVGFFFSLLFFGIFVVREFGFSGGVNFLGFVVVEFGAADEGIDFGVIGSLFVFCLGQLQRERRGLLFA